MSRSVSVSVEVIKGATKPNRRFGERSVVGLHVNASEDIAALIGAIVPGSSCDDRDWTVTFSSDPEVVGVNTGAAEAHFDTTRIIDSVHAFARKEKSSPLVSFQRHVGELVVTQAVGVPDSILFETEEQSLVKKTVLGVAIAAPLMVASAVFSPEILDGVSAEAMQKAESILPFFMLGSTFIFGGLAYGLSKNPPVDRSRYDTFVDQNTGLIHDLNSTILPIFPKRN